jgi:hypothetical protein
MKELVGSIILTSPSQIKPDSQSILTSMYDFLKRANLFCNKDFEECSAKLFKEKYQNFEIEPNNQSEEAKSFKEIVRVAWFIQSCLEHFTNSKIFT